MTLGQYKQVLLIRIDIGMGKGKMAVQAAHGALIASEVSRVNRRSWYDSWKRGGQAKIAVKAESADVLLRTMKRAREDGLPVALVEDAGLTQLTPGTATCLAVGPAPVNLIDPITSQMKLL